MSTRATILIREGNDEIRIYHHCDGYPSGVGKDLKNYLNKNPNRFWDAYGIANGLIKGDCVKDDEYELTSCQHGDEEYAYLIDCKDKSITCYKVGWDEFNWDKDNIVEIP